jgi:hypothetical protein
MANFDSVIASAQKIAAKRASLEAQKVQLQESIKKRQDALIAAYGPDYAKKYQEAVESIEDWEAKNGAVSQTV